MHFTYDLDNIYTFNGMNFGFEQHIAAKQHLLLLTIMDSLTKLARVLRHHIQILQLQ